MSKERLRREAEVVTEVDHVAFELALEQTFDQYAVHKAQALSRPFAPAPGDSGGGMFASGTAGALALALPHLFGSLAVFRWNESSPQSLAAGGLVLPEMSLARLQGATDIDGIPSAPLAAAAFASGVAGNAVAVYLPGVGMTAARVRNCERCPASTTTTQPGASSPGDCVCPPGEYEASRPSPQSAPQCERCPIGSFCPGLTLGSSGSPCPSGRTTLASGATAVSDCVCGPDSFEHRDGDCALCPADSFCNRTHAVPCPANSGTQGKLGSTTSLACACNAGYVSSVAGADRDQRVCSLAPVASYTVAGETELLRPCPPGKVTRARGATSASDCLCKAGTYDDGEQCQVCVPGGFCEGGNIVQCPDGMTSGSGARSLADCGCNDGRYMIDQQCVACEAGEPYVCKHGLLRPCPSNAVAARAFAHALSECVCKTGHAWADAAHPWKGCVLCPAGSFCTSGQELPCPWPKSSAPGGSSFAWRAQQRCARVCNHQTHTESEPRNAPIH